MNVDEANALLPTQISSARPNPLKLKILAIAEPKFGKTSWAMSIPNSLLLATEEGHMFIPGYKIVIECWKAKNFEIWEDDDGIKHMTMVQAIDAICASDQFDFVWMDTADMGAKMCVDYHLKQLGIQHPQDWDFGKGHELALNQPFRQEVGRLIKSGRGVGFISHTETRDSRFASGTKSRKECTLPSGIGKFLIPQADVILHGRFGPVNKETGKRYRIWQTEGSDDMLAGSRVQGEYKVPPRFVIDQEDPWGQWKGFFEDPSNADIASQQYAALMNSKGQPTGTTETDEAPVARTAKQAARDAKKPPTPKAE